MVDLVISFENQLIVSEVKLFLFMWFDVTLICTHFEAKSSYGTHQSLIHPTQHTQNLDSSMSKLINYNRM